MREKKDIEDLPVSLRVCCECGKELDKNDIERSSVYGVDGVKKRICEECVDSIIRSYLNE